jgi:hypothetical protein
MDVQGRLRIQGQKPEGTWSDADAEPKISPDPMDICNVQD